MEHSKLDSLFDNFAQPYEYIGVRPFTDAEDNNLRFIGNVFASGSSVDCYVTPGGSLARRPPFNTAWYGSTGANTIISGKRIDYMWEYLTLPTTTGFVYRYLLMSVYNYTTLAWEMYYKDPSTGALTQFTNVRNINDSTAMHRVGFSRGLAYIKGFPSGSDKLGTIIFDGSTGTPVYRLWGLLGPTTPARITGVTNRLNAALTDSATTVTVVSTTGFSATGTVRIETELITYTGTTATTFTGCTRAASGTKASAHDLNTRVYQHDWTASDHKVDINLGWQYAYTYKTVQGHESNRSDIEHNPDLLPSDTGPFFDLRPKITVQGHSDTTNVTKICIYRTADGGGTFGFVEEITNTGSGAITYEDKSLGTGASGTTKADPLPDTKLDLTRIAPDLTKNSPPPTVNPPLVVGTDNPSINVGHIVSFSSRLWFPIDNVLYFSGDEEITTGIPEEAWPSGTAGNFFRFPDRIIACQPTNSALYILGSIHIYILTGTNKDTFNVRRIASHAGMCDSREASVSFLDRVAYIADDGRVMVISGEYVDLISEPVSDFIAPTSLASSNTIGQLHFFTDRNIQWLICLSPYGLSTAGTARMHIYDWSRSVAERRDFWFPPWTGTISSLCSAGAGSTRHFLVGAAFDDTSTPKATGLTVLDLAFAIVPTGALPDSILSGGAWTTRSYNWAARIQPIKNPPGNHINAHGIPHLTTTLAYVKLDYYCESSSNIGLTVFYDNGSLTGGIAETANQSNPTRRAQSTGYTTREWHVYTVGQDFGLLLDPGSLPANTYVRLDRIAVGACPSAGPDSAGEKDAG